MARQGMSLWLLASSITHGTHEPTLGGNLCQPLTPINRKGQAKVGLSSTLGEKGMCALER